MGLDQSGDTLRQVLRAATARAHDRLDGTMRAVAGWESSEDYARFLSLQYAARLPVEAWLRTNAPADVQPPPQTPLIAADLAQLGENRPTHAITFDPPAARDDAANDDAARRARALGIAWVLAGSSLGNRAILGEIRRKAKAKDWPHWPARFLGDEGMLDFWKAMRAEIESRAEMDAVEVAIHAATAVFDHFLAHAEASQHPRALSV